MHMEKKNYFSECTDCIIECYVDVIVSNIIMVNDLI